jgi:hypothetical protein
MLMSCQFLPKLSIKLLPVYPSGLPELAINSQSFEKNSRTLLRKPKLLFILTSMMCEYACVYDLSKLLFYAIGDSMTRIMNLEMY